MAYAYQAIDELMGGQPQKQNIFAPQPGQEAGTAANGQGEAVKTSTAGDVGATGTGGGQLAPVSSAPKVADTGTQNKTAQAAYKANLGKVKAPGTLQNMQTQIGTAQTALQQQATDYAAKQAASHNYALDQGIAQKAIEDQAATAERGQVGGLLGRGMAEEVENFTPQNVNVNTDLLNTNAGIKQLVAQGRRPTYAGNMAAFDAMLLQADPNFQRQTAEVKAQNAALRENVANTSTASQEAARAAAAANLKTSQEDIEKYLLGYQGNITAEQQAAAAAANAALPEKIKAIKDKVQADLEAEQREKALIRLNADFGAGRASSQLQSIAVDPSQYIDYLKGYDANQFVTQQQAQKFNNIVSLLGGKGGTATQVAAGDLPELYKTRGDELLQTLIEKSSTARNQADITGKDEMKRIMDAANEIAASDNARRLGLTKNYGKDVQSTANQLLKEQLKNDPASKAGFYGYTPELQSLLDKSIQDYIQNKPAAGYSTLGNPKLLGKETYTKEQADRLNAIARDLGMPETYQSGEYSKGGTQSLIDKKQLQDIVGGVLGTYREGIKQKADEAQKQKQIDEWAKRYNGLGAIGDSTGSMIPLPDEALAAGLGKGVQAYSNPLATIRNPNPFA